jgi:hypothetical protein
VPVPAWLSSGSQQPATPVHIGQAVLVPGLVPLAAAVNSMAAPAVSAAPRLNSPKSDTGSSLLEGQTITAAASCHWLSSTVGEGGFCPPLSWT